MARSAETVLKAIVGDLAAQIAVLQSQVEDLTEKLNAPTIAPPSELVPNKE